MQFSHLYVIAALPGNTESVIGTGKAPEGVIRVVDHVGGDGASQGQFSVRIVDRYGQSYIFGVPGCGTGCGGGPDVSLFTPIILTGDYTVYVRNTHMTNGIVNPRVTITGRDVPHDRLDDFGLQYAR